MCSLQDLAPHSTGGECKVLLRMHNTSISKEVELPSSGHRGLPQRVSLIYGYQKNRAGINLHHLYPTLCQQPSQTEGPSSSLLHYLVLYTGTSSHTQQKEKQVPALFRWQADKACPSSQGAIVLSLCTFPCPFQATLISLCTGQACV